MMGQLKGGIQLCVGYQPTGEGCSPTIIFVLDSFPSLIAIAYFSEVPPDPFARDEVYMMVMAPAANKLQGIQSFV